MSIGEHLVNQGHLYSVVWGVLVALGCDSKSAFNLKSEE